MDYDELATKILDTHVLGEYVGGAWNLEQVMRWVPSHVSFRFEQPRAYLTGSRRQMIHRGHCGALDFIGYGVQQLKQLWAECSINL